MVENMGRMLEDEAVLLFEVFESHLSYEWIQETVTIMTAKYKHFNNLTEQFTVAHFALKCRFKRILFDICFDKYDFDADFYRPSAKLTLLHVVAKYMSDYKWGEDD